VQRDRQSNLQEVRLSLHLSILMITIISQCVPYVNTWNIDGTWIVPSRREMLVAKLTLTWNSQMLVAKLTLTLTWYSLTLKL
jgi:hypothetical protein